MGDFGLLKPLTKLRIQLEGWPCSLSVQGKSLFCAYPVSPRIVRDVFKWHSLRNQPCQNQTSMLLMAFFTKMLRSYINISSSHLTALNCQYCWSSPAATNFGSKKQVFSVCLDTGTFQYQLKHLDWLFVFHNSTHMPFPAHFPASCHLPLSLRFSWAKQMKARNTRIICLDYPCSTVIFLLLKKVIRFKPL